MTRPSQCARRLPGPGPDRGASRFFLTTLAFSFALAAAALLPSAAGAQQNPAGRDTLDRWQSGDTVRIDRWGGAPRAARKPPDFLFAEPRGSFALRFGMTFPRAGSDVFTSAFQDLTLRKGDFRALTGGVDLGFRILPRLDAVVSGSYSRSSRRSEFRNFDEIVGNDTFPIQQRTRLSQVPLTAGLKLYLLPRGRQIGHFVWIPTRIAPYVGAGAGVVWHRFEQSGDFVDHRDLGISSETYVADGWSPTAHVFGGLDMGISRHAALKLEGRWAWASADPGPDYSGFNSIDLAGFQTTVGLSWRY